MPSAQLGRHLVGTRRRPHAGELIGADRHADAGPADENAPLDLTVAHLLGHEGREVRVVDRRLARWAVVDHLVTKCLKKRDHLLLKVKSPMVTSNGNSHETLPPSDSQP